MTEDNGCVYPSNIQCCIPLHKYKCTIMYTYACTYWLADDIIRVHAYLFASVVFNVYIDVYFVFCFCMFIYVFRFSVVISLPCILDAQNVGG